MIMSVEQLLDEVKNGTLVEHRHPNVELKPNWDIEYGKKISGLANRLENQKSWLIVGVNDDGLLSGRDESWVKGVEQVISQQANNFLNPTQTVRQISCFEVNTHWIIVISIQSPGAVTYWQDIPYKASGTTFIPMIPEEIMQLTVTLPGLEDFSAQKWQGGYDSALVIKFAEAVSAKRNEPQFKDLTKLSPDDIITRLGIRNKIVVRILFGDFGFRIVFYNTKNEPVENTEVQGLISLLSSDVIGSIQRWAKKDQEQSSQEITITEEAYPSKALREALANSVAHAAYFEKQGEVLVEVFTEKIIISNLCLPESSYFANKWFSRSRNTVNRLLMEILRLGGYVDELGRGKNLIFSESIKAGHKPPIVNIEKAGQYNRWRLYLYGVTSDAILMRLFQRIKDLYKDEHKALVAFALVLWSENPVSRISQLIDGESKPYFEEILQDVDGPVFFYRKEDKLIHHRWVRVLLREGKDSKAFTLAEEEGIRDFASDFCLQFERGHITPQSLRKLAHLGETSSEQNLSSGLLRKWQKEGHIEPNGRGKYRFKEPKKQLEGISALLDRLVKEGEKAKPLSSQNSSE